MTVGDLQKRVGQNIRRHREERGLSQESFADVLGWHRTYIGGIERGERNLSLQSVERISEQLGIDPNELLQPADVRRSRG